MRVKLLVCLAFFGAVTLFAPDIVSAQPASLVQCGNGPSAGYEECTVCDLVRLGQNVIEFFVYGSVLVATLLFVNAGVLYVMSPSNPGNVSKAHRIFTNTLIGMILILTSWLMVDFVMKTLYGGAWGPWNTILCQGGPEGVSPPELQPPAPVVIPPGAIGTLTTAQALAQLAGTAPPVETSGVSNGPPIQQYVIDGIIGFNQACGDCVVVTSLSGGHSSGGHVRGVKADLRVNPATEQYIQNNWARGVPRGGSHGGPTYIGPAGMVCVQESAPPHFDCCFRVMNTCN